MRRRRLLAGLALSLGLAGCNSPETTPTDGTPRTTSSTTRTTAPPTITATPTTAPPTETETPTETATPTETETETPTETATPEPSPGERKAAERIGRARTHMQTALDAYVGVADDGSTLLDVSAAVEGFEYPVVTNPLSDARSDLDEAAETAIDEQAATIADLRVVVDFLEYAARTQSNLWKGYAATKRGKEYWYDEQFSFVNRELNQIETSTDESSEWFEDLEDTTTADPMAAFEPIGSETYEEKIDQFETELATLEGLPSLFEDAITALDRFGMGAGAWDAEKWVEAKGRFENTVAAFEDLMAEFEDIERAPAFEPIIEEMEGVANILVDASALLRDGASAEVDHESDTRKRKKQAADERLRESALVTDIESVEQVLEAT